MKTILLFICLLVASVANAMEYVITKTPTSTIIYSIDNEGSGAEYINAYLLSSNPSISELRECGLPSTLWSVLDQGFGIYDTRLINARSTIEQQTSRIEDDTAYISKLETRTLLLGIVSTILFAACLGLLAFKK